MEETFLPLWNKLLPYGLLDHSVLQLGLHLIFLSKQQESLCFFPRYAEGHVEKW